MGLFKKKPDPLNERARALNAEISALEAEIKKLSTRNGSAAHPRVRSTAHRGAATTVIPPDSAGTPSKPAAPPEPIFESVDLERVKSSAEPENTPAHYNDLGIRKYDLVALWHRLSKHLTGPPTSNPKLINYLAAGSIHGLRPLRYEKRVARNRVIVLAVILFVIICGILAIRNH
jgi:hypothetical protein